MTQGFYNCPCGWSGNALRYIDMVAACLLQIPQGQGVCPECTTLFQGCVHPDMIVQWRADKAALHHGQRLDLHGSIRYELVRDDGDMSVGWL